MNLGRGVCDDLLACDEENRTDGRHPKTHPKDFVVNPLGALSAIL